MAQFVTSQIQQRRPPTTVVMFFHIPLKTSPNSVAISLTMSMRGLQNVVVITAVTVGLILSKIVTALQQRDEILLERSNFVVGTGIYDM